MLQIEFSITISLFYTLRKCHEMKFFNNIFEFFSTIFFSDNLYELKKQELKIENVKQNRQCFFFDTFTKVIIKFLSQTRQKTKRC